MSPHPLLRPTLAAAVLTTLAFYLGCQASPAVPATPGPSSATASPTQPAMLATAGAAAAGKGRAQLWSQTCSRCHTVRSPDSYTANEWSIVMTQMRVRGYLTGAEQKSILEFLQSQ